MEDITKVKSTLLMKRMAKEFSRLLRIASYKAVSSNMASCMVKDLPTIQMEAATLENIVQDYVKDLVN